MKQLFLIVTIFFIIFSACQSNKQLSKDKSWSSVYAQSFLRDCAEIRKNQIKTRYKYAHSNLSLDSFLVEVIQYDKEGRTLNIETIGAKGKADLIEKMFYKDNLLFQRIIKDQNASNIVFQYEYDKTGRLMKRTKTGTKPCVYTYVYNNEGYVSKIHGQYIALRTDSSIVWKYDYKYDKKGNEIQVKSYTYNEPFIDKRSVYNAKNQLIKTIEFPDEDPSVITLYYYENNLLVRDELEGFITLKHIYKYDFYD